jgi:hypothetical protein
LRTKYSEKWEFLCKIHRLKRVPIWQKFLTL